MGSLGEPDGGWPKKLQKIILQRREAAARPSRRAICRRSISRRPPRALEKKIGRKPSHDEVLSYLMYPDVFLKFAEARQNWGDVDVLPTPQFYYGMERGERHRGGTRARQGAGDQVPDRSASRIPTARARSSSN